MPKRRRSICDYWKNCSTCKFKIPFLIPRVFVFQAGPSPKVTKGGKSGLLGDFRKGNSQIFEDGFEFFLKKFQAMP